MSEESGRSSACGNLERSDEPEGAAGFPDAPGSAGALGPEEDSQLDDDDRVDESGRESFPASDPPGFWAGSDEPRRPAPT